MEPDSRPILSPVHTTLATIASVLGLILIGFGLWAIGGAIYAAWSLFQDPEGIAYIADYFMNTTKLAALLQENGEGLAHFLSWFIAILMLLVLGKLGDWAISAGAYLMGNRRN